MLSLPLKKFKLLLSGGKTLIDSLSEIHVVANLYCQVILLNNVILFFFLFPDYYTSFFKSLLPNRKMST